ncbi:endonuclease [Marilutibacter maris]|uniref:Ribonuclease n=1 Tax=Marilutibacter maris TaxID=1605891 RepID=A0A2U9TFT3_9GAMM|nr:endonuclease [Lysobacter maris]AWV08479.1 ribonuclease [Lysobacter maris]
MIRRSLWLALAVALAPAPALAEVFINEIHYDNDGSDTGEAIEVVASEGESLSGYRIYLYNGSSSSSASVYDNDPLPAGSMVACGGNVRIASLSYPSNGIQNGAPDAIALVDGSGALVQFLSYEGTVTAGNGPAAGQTSTALPVSETGSTPVGHSLQLGGSGDGYSDFSWQSAAAQTFGACNNGQSFSTPNPPPEVTATQPVDGATNFPAAGDLGVAFTESVSLGGNALTLQCAQSGTIALQYPSSGSSFTATTGTALYAGEACTFTVHASQVTDGGGAHPVADTVVAFNVASNGGGNDDYYAQVNTSSASQLRCSLHQTIRGHTVYPYSGSGTTSTWDILEIADEDPNNGSRILDAYRNRSYAKGSDRAGTGSGATYNREHSWPNSLGFGNRTGNLGLPNAPYTDTHMLYLTDTGYNSDRGNKPYKNCPSQGSCGERVTDAYNGNGGGSGVFPGNSNWTWSSGFQVWGARRGDMARAVMYMAIRYEGGQDINSGQSEPDLELTDNANLIVATSSSPAYMGLLSTLLAWHQADPPDDAERARNDVIYSFQGNRNPFIDHPEWASEALFTSSQPASCQLN